MNKFKSIISYLILRGGGHPENSASNYFGITCKRHKVIVDSAIASYLILGLNLTTIASLDDEVL